MPLGVVGWWAGGRLGGSGVVGVAGAGVVGKCGRGRGYGAAGMVGSPMPHAPLPPRARFAAYQ